MLTVIRKGIADEELARKAAERGRKRKIDDVGRSPSMSTHSSTSVSTISTARSSSRSPVHAGKNHTGQSQMMSNLEVGRKRRRSISSMSYDSHSSYERRRRNSSSERESWSRKAPGPNGRITARRRQSRSRSSSGEICNRTRREPSEDPDRSKRRRRASISPGYRGRNIDGHKSWGSRRTKSPSDSRDRSQVLRNRKSMTPGVPSKPSKNPRGHGRPSFDRHSSYSDDHERYGGSARKLSGDTADSGPSHHHREHPRKRSLSPFSKRLALTQAMNMS